MAGRGGAKETHQIRTVQGEWGGGEMGVQGRVSVKSGLEIRG
jgi:hypothetical protein